MACRRRSHRALRLLLALLALPLLSRCVAPVDERPNVLWIVWDTARADRLSLYGHDRPTTPFLDRWAADSRVFENCLSVAGYTIPSHASMFTGLLPAEHCAHNDAARLDDRFSTVAEILRGVGYRTFLYSANPNVSESRNFQQGFEVAEYPWSPRHAERARQILERKLAEEETTSELGRLFERNERGEGGLSAWSIKAAGEIALEALQSWLDGGPPEQPYFAFVNYMEAHRPLVPPRRYREKFMSDAEVTDSYAVDRGWLPTWEYVFGLREYGDEELALTRATYDAALLELDTLFGELIESLRASGRLENTVVIVTSDHGEHLGEHHMLDHQYSLYEPLLRIPLIVHYPARLQPGRDARPVSNVDLFPTILELTGSPLPSGHNSAAVSLLAPRDERMRLAEDPAHARVPIALVKQAHPDWNAEPWERRLRAVTVGDRKLIEGSDGELQLFDLGRDPQELENLTPRDAAEAAALRERAALEFGPFESCRSAMAPPSEMTADEIRRLKALGYFGGED